MTLVDVRVFRVPAGIVGQTQRALAKAGADGYEAFVLWSGLRHQEVFEIRTPHLPRQRSYKTEDGLLVRIGGDALDKLNRWLYDHGEELAAQVHAHPTDAFHSTVDDEYPIVTALGGLSVVAADFATSGVLTRDTAIFRLGAAGWTPVPLDVVQVVP